jgi:hypothetical protein
MTESASSYMAMIFGLAVFAIIVAVGWRSVQNRRILRLQGASGQETIIVAREDDDISSIVTTTETMQVTSAQAPSQVVANTSVAHPVSRPEFGRAASESKAAGDLEANAAGRDRLDRVVTSTKTA